MKHFQFAVWTGAAIWRTIKPVLLFTTLLLLSLGLLACRLTSSTPEAITPSPLPPPGETPAVQQPTLAPTATPMPPSTPSPTPTVEPTPTLPPTLTIEPTPTLLAFKGPAVSYSGISFAVDPVLGDEVFVGTPDSLSYVEFSFAPEGYCREVGCVTIYPVEPYRDGIPFGTDIIDGLRSAIETQSNDYFPVLMAHILLRAKTRHLRFRNGAGIRAIVMKGQDTVYANNESVVYEFHGLTDDGQYYVAATFPIDAPMLLSACCDPAENKNKDAIPVPALPDDDVQAGAVIHEYNREAQRQLNALDGSGFTPNLELLDALVSSLLITPSAELQVDVNYRGTWYRETFSYTKQAENIAHFVLVMPESQVDRATADQVFSSIDFSTFPGALSVREGREEFAWTLEYVHDAPEGYFRGQFEPGTYYVAAAFVAAPLSREQAGQPDDDTLYVGMTGGGASTDYWKIELEPGENAVTLSLTDKDGWACPWLYVYNGHFFERRTEILRNVRGKRNERTEFSAIGPVEIVDGAITFRVAEEKDEIAFVDELYIIVDGIEVHAEANSGVAVKDQHYLVLISGDSREFRFRLPDSLASRESVTVSVVVSGFYVPLE